MMILLLAGNAQAQQLPQADGEASGQAPAEPAPPPVDGPVTTLGEVRALKPEDDQPLNLYRFKNPVQAVPNRFSKNWSEPPSPEQVGMSGGYVMMGIAYGLLKAGQGLNKLTGGPDQIQSAIARPPPELSAEQQARAAAFCAQQDCTQAGDGR
ncbi:hypothetical protein [Alcaligenes phenolicus]|uniref:hypothetical protein n=2 Tax=Pseudomonadota TaxID=1224 RepID=UPI002AA7AB7C|nr:hypothetical protein [Alcaligenes phenolicus]